MGDKTVLVYDLEVSGSGIFRELSERSLQGFSSTANLLRYNIHIRYVTDVIKVFRWFSCSTFEKFFRRSSFLQRFLPECEEFVRDIYPGSVYQLTETLFDKLKALDIEVTEDILLSTNFPVFDFESISLKSSTIADTETTTWVGKHERTSVSITSNLLEETIFICDTEPQSLVSTFVTTSENLAEKKTRNGSGSPRYWYNN